MQQPAGTLPSDGDDVDDGAGRSHPNANRARGAAKFVYASGSRPLEGYTIKRGIGIGGFGEVYYATSDAGKDVALKHIQRNLDVELRGVRQCLNLKHPNLVALYDIKYDQDDRAWVVMEYAAGESLQEVIDRNPNGIPEDQAAMWIRGIAAGLGYLHDHGIVHRDLKPGNIFLDEGVVKIGDYGLSKFISCSRRSGQTESVGTFHYMAPEIGRGRYGKEIDIYALGIILYEMLTGNVPFDGESSQEIIMKHLTARPSLNRVPPTFRTVIANALAKDPQQRTDSVRKMMSQMPAISGAVAIDTERESPVIDAEVVGPGRGNVHPTQVPGPGAAPAGTTASDASPPLPEEPIAHAVHDSWIRLRRGWDNAHLGTVPRFVILLFIVFALLTNIGWLVPLGMLTGMIYLVYLLIRTLAVNTAGQPTCIAAAPHQPVTVPESPKRPAVKVAPRQRPWQDVAREQLRTKPRRVRLTELIGSLLMAAVACAVLCLVMLVFASQAVETSLLSWAPLYTWMTLTSILGTWSVLACCKLWEGSHDEPSLRRFTMLAVGLAVGAAAFGLAQGLDIEPTYLLEAPRSFHEYPTTLYENNGTPNALGYLGYFAGLFVVLRWWKQADPLRQVRLSIFATFVCVLWAIILFAFLPFPRGFLVAATMSIAVQLSSPWLSHEQRKHLHKKKPRRCSMSVRLLLLMLLAVPVVLLTGAALVALIAIAGRRVWRVLPVLLVVALALLAVSGGVIFWNKASPVVVEVPQAVEQPDLEITREIAELERRADELRRRRAKLRSLEAADPSRLTPPEEDAAFVVHQTAVVRDDGATPLLEHSRQPDLRNEQALAGNGQTPVSMVDAGNQATGRAPKVTAEVVSDQQFEDVAIRETPRPEREVDGMAGQASSSSDHARSSQLRPAWVGSPRHWEGSVHTTQLAIGPYSTLDECQRLVDMEAQKALAQYDDWYLGQRGGSHQMLIRTSKYSEDWADPEHCYHETSQSRILGEKMHTLHVLLRFPEAYRRELDSCWQQTIVAGRLTRVALLSGAVFAFLASLYLYLRLDLATKGCYARRLQCGLASTILALAVTGVLLARWIPWI